MVDSGKRRGIHFCQIGDIDHRLKAICPLKHLVTLIQSTPDETFFPPSEITSKVLTKHMKGVACIEKIVKLHSSRIDCHTFYTVYGLDADFRDYLARRKVNKSTQTHYRASPYQTIYKLRRFFTQSFKETCQTREY